MILTSYLDSKSLGASEILQLALILLFSLGLNFTHLICSYFSNLSWSELFWSSSAT